MYCELAKPIEEPLLAVIAEPECADHTRWPLHIPQSEDPKVTVLRSRFLDGPIRRLLRVADVLVSETDDVIDRIRSQPTQPGDQGIGPVTRGADRGVGVFRQR